MPTSHDQWTQRLRRPSVWVAPRLLGAVLTRRDGQGTVAIRLTEVEAYAGTADPGSHAYRGPTPRTAVMFGPPARLYVYFSYGMHWCANLVTGPDGEASAVLLRAGQVIDGLDLARSRRPGAVDRDLARGPARLASTLGLHGVDNGDMVRFDRPAADGPGVWLQPRWRSLPKATIRSGPRVGVSGPGGDGAVYPWRFWVDGDRTVSAYRPGRPPRGHGDGLRHP